MIRKRDPDAIRSYIEDESDIFGCADEVLLPESEEEIAEVLKETEIKGIPVTFSGARTGVVGGAVPEGGILLSAERMDRIVELDREKQYVVVQPGVSLRELNSVIEKEGLFYPPDPTEDRASLGGNLATDASGARSLKYGSTRRYVRRLKIALSGGRVLEIERGKLFAENRKLKIDDIEVQLPSYNMPSAKSNAGYYVKDKMDVIDLFIGSEGTLGFVTEIELSLLKKKESILCSLFFEKEEDAFLFSQKIRGSSISIEYLDKKSLSILREDYSSIPKACCGILFETEEEPHLDVDCTDAWLAESTQYKNRLREMRRRLPQAINERTKRKIAGDLAVPDRVYELIDFCRKFSERAEIECAIFGHIGENHIHINLLPETEEVEKEEAVLAEITKKALSLSGTVSAEHGIGKKKKKLLELMFGERMIEEMKKVKAAFDPGYILQRGVMF